MLEKYLGRQAIVILYDRDLSSRMYTRTLIDSSVVSSALDSWLAIIIVVNDERCEMVIVSEGGVDVHEYRGGFFYRDVDSVVKRDLSSIESVCR